jgi:CDP-diglyceride synthetase
MWINLVCAVIFFLLVPGILFTIPTKSKYTTAAAHAVLFVIVHHYVNAYLQKHYGMKEPQL